jgi:hypothetical protein
MTSARICVNEPSNSKLDSHYNMVVKTISQALQCPGLRMQVMSRISSIVALSAPISQFKKTKALDMITICASWANTCRKL